MKLHRINILAKPFMEFCEQKNFESQKPKSEIVSIKKNIKRRLALITNKQPFFDEKEWILERLKRDFRKYKPNKNRIFLNHGDPADNLIINQGQINIIDWEYTKFTYGPGLIHILAHGRLPKEKETKLLSLYAKVSELDYDELFHKTYLEKSAHYLLKTARLIEKFPLKEQFRDNLKTYKKDITHLKDLYLKCIYKANNQI